MHRTLLGTLVMAALTTGACAGQIDQDGNGESAAALSPYYQIGHFRSVNGYAIVSNNEAGPGMAVAVPAGQELGASVGDVTRAGVLRDGDAFVLVDSESGYYFSAQCGGGSQPGCGTVEVNRTQALGWETFTAHKLGGLAGPQFEPGDTFDIQSAAGFYCTAEQGGASGQPFTCNRTAVGGWETFSWGN